MPDVLNKPDFATLVRAFGRIGLINFGGPAGQIALMHKDLVDDRRWIAESDFLHALNFCHLLPGPEAQQLATYVGWRLHGVRGGLAAGLLFVAPGALVMLALSALYAFAAHLGWFAALFLGIKAAVLAIVVQALLRIAGRTLDTPFKKALAVAAFFALFLFNLPFPLIVLGSGLLGLMVSAWRPQWLVKAYRVETENVGDRPNWRSTALTVSVWLLIWFAPLALIGLALGPDHILWKIGVFFSQLAVVTFGGAYAVLAYMAQEAVQSFGWLQPGEMADGLGLAETTPGPLIMVTQFVGFLAAFRAPEPFTPLLAGLAGAALTTWVTFAPCFLWIFACAPWIDRLRHATRLKGGLAAITATVVGVIGNLSAWFALHVLFRRVDMVDVGFARFSAPLWSSFDVIAAGLTALAFFLMFVARWNIVRTLGLCAGAGLLASLL
ncbi:chromate efflux transporter [Aquisediminimonas profunda]|uniref:chromate efflux transporter n=1 Tax=Aquisediminimonas profunda TaxID=1550733 RepID=UPI001C632D01|nr:chromate efflux transporter [Aquisediminimonas profunda]